MILFNRVPRVIRKHGMTTFGITARDSIGSDSGSVAGIQTKLGTNLPLDPTLTPSHVIQIDCGGLKNMWFGRYPEEWLAYLTVLIVLLVIGGGIVWIVSLIMHLIFG